MKSKRVLVLMSDVTDLRCTVQICQWCQRAHHTTACMSAMEAGEALLQEGRSSQGDGRDSEEASIDKGLTSKREGHGEAGSGAAGRVD